MIRFDFTIYTRLNSECDGGEVESKNGFEEHHSARGRSKKLRFTDVGKANLVREGRNETLLYTAGTPADLSRKGGRSEVRPGRLRTNVVLSMGRTIDYSKVRYVHEIP